MIKWVLIFFLIVSCTDNTEEDMKFLVSSLTDTQSVRDVPIPTATTYGQVLSTVSLGEADVTSFYWLFPYLASDFPEITGITKKYIFLWSTDHQTNGSFWGQGDNLNLSDFTYGGRMIIGNSSETPRMYRNRVDGNIHIYFHPNTEAGITDPSIQQTDLYICSSGGSLNDLETNVNWSFVNNPLGMYTTANGNQIGGYDEIHTGYFQMQLLSDGVTYEGRHLVVPGDYTVSKFRWSTSLDGINWTRRSDGDIPRYYRELDVNGPWTAGTTGGVYYYLGGKWFNVHSTKYDETSSAKGVAIDLLDNNFRNPIFQELVVPISNYSAITSYYDAENQIIHIYMTVQQYRVFYATLDVSKANKWILIP